MAEFSSFAYARLDGHDVGDSAIGFYDELLTISRELLKLENEIAGYRIDRTGFLSQNAIQRFEKRYVSLVNDIQQSSEAVVTGEPWKLERFERGFAGEINDFNKLQNTYAGQINELERVSARISQLLESKRSAAHARITATISTAAVVVSALALLVNLLV